MKFIPTAQDFLQEMETKPWMDNGNGIPDSFKKLENSQKCFENDFTKETKNSTTIKPSSLFLDGVNKSFTAD